MILKLTSAVTAKFVKYSTTETNAVEMGPTTPRNKSVAVLPSTTSLPPMINAAVIKSTIPSTPIAAKKTIYAVKAPARSSCPQYGDFSFFVQNTFLLSY